MKKNPLLPTLCALLGACTVASATEVLLPNGDFETTGGASWDEISGDGAFFFDYFTTGGNPGGYLAIDDPDGSGFGIAVSNDNNPTSFASLGLVSGKRYAFNVDMKVFSGSSIGGLKVDFFNGLTLIGSTGDRFAEAVGGGGDWETYSWNFTMPDGADGIKVVLLWGANSVVGFDNVRVNSAALPALTGIPNGDFSTTGGAEWVFDSGGGTFAESFPASGGNAGGYGRIDHSANDGGFAVFVSNNRDTIPIADLGLFADSAYNFSMDMRIESGSNIGGFKVDFFDGEIAAGSSGDIYPTTLIGTGATWETYEFEINIPAGVNAIKVVPLWGPGSIVGYDNITFDPNPIVVAPVTGIPNGDFESGLDSWAQAGAPNTTFAASAAGGNPDGYVTMSNDGNGFGVLVSSGGAVLPIAGLGLSAGEAYTFSMDMRIESGVNLGGLKVEFYNGVAFLGDTGDMRPAIIGTGATWETYEFTVPLPAGADGIKLVPLWGSGSVVGYDNVAFDDTPLILPPILNFDFESGLESWQQVGAPDTTFSSSATGGNPDGYGIMDNNGFGFGVLVANNGAIIPLADLGLNAGESATFNVDMITLAGADTGGIKIEYYNGVAGAGDSTDLRMAPVGSGASWETFSFDVDIPEGVDGIKVVLLWGPGSAVGFDNVTAAPTPPSNTFSDWIAGFPGVGGLTGFNDDADNDGNGNGLENFFGTDPSAFSAGLVSGEVSGSTFTFTHPQNASPADDINGPTYTWSTDLQNFFGDGASNGAGTAVSFSASLNTPVAGVTTVTATVTGASGANLYVKVGVTQAP